MGKVAVVDDAAEALAWIAKILRGEGYEVLPYQDSVGLEEKLSVERPDLVLLDIVMPGRNGFDALRGLKRCAATAAVPVVLVSRKSEAADMDWARAQGADGYLTKPVDAGQLVATVRQWVDR